MIGRSEEALEAAGHGDGAQPGRRRPEVEDDGSPVILSGSVYTERRNRFAR
jgi:hypothetical protein